MERARLDVTTTLADEADDPLPELGGGLVGERDREDAERRDALDADQIRDAVGEDTRLPGAGTREDQQRSVRRGDGARLLWIEGSQDLCLAFGASLREDLGIGPRGQRCGRVALWRLPSGVAQPIGLVRDRVGDLGGDRPGITEGVVEVGSPVRRRVLGLTLAF